MGQRAAIYCRVSTADQSCERQERDLTAFAHRAGFEVTAIFKETGSGAKLVSDVRSWRWPSRDISKSFW
ncbi:recombinase family protein [Pseudomonas meliae]|uniref:recombinase family protein n=1 Tax=Pseudomonas meliae TaxID=86176 RepID=UPI0022866BA0|nr:recombinase family protein [Pseudomonas meliae]